ncbi:MAG: hypothetical protein MMC33_003180 [Icmadophila ericetorum]|nr:hypothetical protein [Icmadophila ericetorum]
MPLTPLIDITFNPPIPEALPLYTRRDPETASIRSSAPSYVSEAPTYHSTRPPLIHAQTTGSLPNPTFAPGFHRPYTSSRKDISNLRFNINEWSSVYNGPQAKHYQAVAHRRATLASADFEPHVQTLARVLFPPGPSTGPTEENAIPEEHNEEAESDPVRFPLEDPDLVGPTAARQARERRLYLAKHEREQAAMKQEVKSWDFMLAQMADWKERERSWDNFRREVGKTRILRRRIGT